MDPLLLRFFHFLDRMSCPALEVLDCRAAQRQHVPPRDAHRNLPPLYAAQRTEQPLCSAFCFPRTLHQSPSLSGQVGSLHCFPATSSKDTFPLSHTLSPALRFSSPPFSTPGPLISIMAGAAFRTARIELPKTAFFLCDMQERFKTAIANFDLITNTSARMLKAANILDVPVFTTEQNPKGEHIHTHSRNSPVVY